jgi:sporulation protein YlmC with PRC-barrel domain
VLPLALDASAQAKKDTYGVRDAEKRAWTMPADVMESKKLIGTHIVGADGKKLGEIDQVLVHPSDGKISHVVIGLGGVAGIGEKKVVVPWSDVKLTHDRAANKWVATVDRAALDQAPRFEARGAERSTAPAASPATSPKSEQPASGTKNNDVKTDTTPRR